MRVGLWCLFILWIFLLLVDIAVNPADLPLCLFVPGGDT